MRKRKMGRKKGKDRGKGNRVAKHTHLMLVTL